MKPITLVLAAFFLSFSAVASEPIHCSLSLMAPMPHAPKHLWIAPMTGIYEFDYDPSTEMTVKVAVKAVVPNPEFTQYGLDTAKGENDTALAIEFSKTSPDGDKFVGNDFGFYFRLPTDGQNPAWALGGYSQAASTKIAITKEQTGYVVMNCR